MKFLAYTPDRERNHFEPSVFVMYGHNLITIVIIITIPTTTVTPTTIRNFLINLCFIC